MAEKREGAVHRRPVRSGHHVFCAARWKHLLEGVNIGGLSTPIASLASLITLKLYLGRPGAKAGKYLLVFTAANLAGLVILLTVALL